LNPSTSAAKATNGAICRDVDDRSGRNRTSGPSGPAGYFPAQTGRRFSVNARAPSAPASLAALSAPVRLLISEHSLPVFADIARRLGERLGVDVAITPGGHAPYHDDPYELAEKVRPFLREFSG
jgi:pimeloyl-ACP methyl ester carboxylesterase